MAVKEKGDFFVALWFSSAGKYFKKRVRWENLYGFFIPLIITIFILLIIGLFFAYRQSNQVEKVSLEQQLTYTANITEKIAIQNKIYQIQSWWSQLWSFFDTDTFKTLAMSVLLTALLTALGKIFKIKEAFDERIRTQRQKRIENQIKCIKATEKMWDELYGLVSEVRFYDPEAVLINNMKPGLEPKDRKRTIEEIIMHSEGFASKAEEIVSQWHFVFPILPKIGEASNREIRKRLSKHIKDKREVKKDYEVIKENRRPSRMIVFFINILYEAASSVAYYIKAKKDHSEIVALQNSLGVIQDVIKDKVHQYMVTILKCAVEPQEGYEDEEQSNYNQDDINKNTNGLFINYLEMRLVVHNIPPLPSVGTNSEPGKNFLNNLDNYLKTIKDQCEVKTLTEKETELFLQLKGSFNNTDGGEITKAWEYKYSKTTLEKLAKSLSFISVYNDLDDRKQWLCLLKYFDVKDYSD